MKEITLLMGDGKKILLRNSGPVWAIESDLKEELTPKPTCYGGGDVDFDNAYERWLAQNRDTIAWNTFCDTFESLILSLAAAGVEVTSHSFLEGIQAAYEVGANRV